MSTEHRNCMCAQLEREMHEVQDMLAEARRSYTDEDWAYINRDVDLARARRDARAAAVEPTTEGA
jgi:uncharacterized protein YeeX (DUF496 family)